MTTAHDNTALVSIQRTLGQPRSSNHFHGKQECAVGKGCEATNENGQTNNLPEPSRNCYSRFKQSSSTCLKKTPRKCTDDIVVSVADGRAVCSSDVIDNQLSFYGFNAADWSDDNFTDDWHATDTVQPLSNFSANRNASRNTKPCFKIYEDSGDTTRQNAVGQSLKKFNAKVLCDRTNVARQMSTICNSPLAKRTGEPLCICDGNHVTMGHRPSKTCEATHRQRASIVDCRNTATNSFKLPSLVDAHVSKTRSVVCNNISCSGTIVLPLTTISDTMTALSSTTTTAVTASRHMSLAASSSLAILTSSNVTFRSSMTSAVDRPITCTSPVSSVAVCWSSIIFSQSARRFSVVSIPSSFSSTSAVPQLCRSTATMTPNQSSLRSSGNSRFSTPGMMVTPCNQPVQNSTMRPTPPMCSCGCRAKRKFVQSPGQNMGRPFYCCGFSSRASRKGCTFFKWENSPSLTSATHSAEVTPLSTKLYLSAHTTSRNNNFTTPLSNHAQRAKSFHVLVPPSFR